MPKPLMPIIEDERVRLRPLTEDDLPLTLTWRNQDVVRQWFFHSDLIQFEQHRAWFEIYRERERRLRLRDRREGCVEGACRPVSALPCGLDAAPGGVRPVNRSVTNGRGGWAWPRRPLDSCWVMPNATSGCARSIWKFMRPMGQR